MFRKSLGKIVKLALEEDCVLSDITSDLTIPGNSVVTFEIKPREDIIFFGREVVNEVFLQLKLSKKFRNSAIKLEILARDGDAIKSGKSIARGKGDARLIFAAERVVLNLIQHLSGVATLTQKFVKKLNNKKIKILDTRKTLPGLRVLEKQAVVAGGGKNHRLNLSDMILIKDNHIAAAGGVKNALTLAKKSKTKLPIEIECETFQQVREALELRPDIIMLDNMNVGQIKKCSTMIRKNSGKKIKIEISGGVNLSNLKNFRGLDIDFISSGYLTHSAAAVNIGLDIITPSGNAKK